MPSTYLVTGANRGLGLALTDQLCQAGNRVIATARDPEDAPELQKLASAANGGGAGTVRIETLDVSSDDSVHRLRERLGKEPDGAAIDVLINNAGIGGDRKGLFEQNWDNHHRCFEVNAIGPLRVTLGLIDLLRAGQRKLVVNITSQLGSMTLNTGGGYHPYRASKAALNMNTRTLAADLGRDGFTCLMLHPGWVRTDMGGEQAPLSSEESARGMLEVIANATAKHNGRFYDYAGKEMPW